MTTEEIKELALTIIASLDLGELAHGYRRRLLIIDSQIQELRAQIEALLKVRGELENELIQFRADRQICGRLNLLCQPPKRKKENVHRNRDSGKIQVNITKPSQGIG